MAVAKWTARSTWADLFNSVDLNALANGSGILSTAAAVDNTTNLNFYADVSIRSTSTMSPTAGGHFAIYLLPLLDDGTTYPNSTNTGTAGDQPPLQYLWTTIALRTTAGSTQNHMARRLEIPNGIFKAYFVNRSGVAMPSSNLFTVKYATYSEQA